MSLLQNAGKLRFNFERPDLKEFEINGARISISKSPNLLLSVAHRMPALFYRLDQLGIETVEMGVRGQSGFGNVVTSQKGGYEFENYLYDINGVINSLDVRQIKMMGYSFAGYFSLAYAVQNPSRVSSLILVEPGWEVEPEELKRRAELSLSEQGIAGIVAMLDYVKPGLDEAQKYQMAEEISADWQSNEAIANNYLVRAGNPITKEDLASLQVPTLLIYGGKSKFRDSTVKAASYIPNSSLWCVDGADHLTIASDKRYGVEMADVIANFIKHKG